MNVLRAKNLCKTYIVNRRHNNVLRNVNLEIEEGEMVGIMGPSGSGKTTLLYTVSGMDTATAGDIEFFGEELTKLSADQVSDLRLKRMGFVFQQMYMLKNLSIYDNIILPAYQADSRKEQRRKINERAKVLMAKLGISEVADNDISEVSGGQLQRACIARSMINNPKIIFADEPTGALDSTSGQEVLKLFGNLNQMGNTIVMITHDLKVAKAAKRIVRIVDGCLSEYEKT